MIRVPPYLDNCTSVFPRTTRCDGHAIYYYQAPITRRFFYALMRWGWAIVPAVLLSLVLTGCDDLDGYTAAQADLADAIATAAKEAGNVEVAAK